MATARASGLRAAARARVGETTPEDVRPVSSGRAKLKRDASRARFCFRGRRHNIRATADAGRLR